MSDQTKTFLAVGKPVERTEGGVTYVSGSILAFNPGETWSAEEVTEGGRNRVLYKGPDFDAASAAVSKWVEERMPSQG